MSKLTRDEVLVRLVQFLKKRRRLKLIMPTFTLKGRRSDSPPGLGITDFNDLALDINKEFAAQQVNVSGPDCERVKNVSGLATVVHKSQSLQ